MAFQKKTEIRAFTSVRAHAKVSTLKNHRGLIIHNHQSRYEEQLEIKKKFQNLLFNFWLIFEKYKQMLHGCIRRKQKNNAIFTQNSKFELKSEIKPF